MLIIVVQHVTWACAQSIFTIGARPMILVPGNYYPPKSAAQKQVENEGWESAVPYENWMEKREEFINDTIEKLKQQIEATQSRVLRPVGMGPVPFGPSNMPQG